ncbi:hypothetical protein [Macrococcus capreoli]|uniref:hypothetical protein n=1 Tax=Macrococcus capreoli TaxID=2982690 RepID=UPI0021D60573|nr:hypothetical protein [Macrococcus sp. TMW 2.2395]MCU7557631.1 hypothetical protein [Macrococcus sp. TMW 2.2395]
MKVLNIKIMQTLDNPIIFECVGYYDISNKVTVLVNYNPQTETAYEVDKSYKKISGLYHNFDVCVSSVIEKKLKLNNQKLKERII